MRTRTVRQMGRSRPRSGDPRAGQALVEFALVAPILLLLLLGIVDFARAWNVYEVLTDAAREGAREAVVDNGRSEAEVRQIIIDAAARAGVEVADADIQITGMGSGRGNPTTVRIEHLYPLRFVGALVQLAQGGDDLVLATEFAMRNE
jgi:Flp pilus assembly protein TadG